MIKFVIEETNENLTPHSGLGLVGQLLSKTNLSTRLDQLSVSTVKTNPDVPNSDVAKSYLGLLCQGKSDFECIEEFREELFYQYALDVHSIPSCSTLRQRLNEGSVPPADDTDPNSPSWKSILLEESAELVQQHADLLTPIRLKNGNFYLPLDVDVSPFDIRIPKKKECPGPIKSLMAMLLYLPIWVEKDLGSMWNFAMTPHIVKNIPLNF